VPCPSCLSSHQREFPAEVNIHLSGMKNIDNPGVLAYPKVLVCLDCGFSLFTTLEKELAVLRGPSECA
jgi:hypothetical protein